MQEPPMNNLPSDIEPSSLRPDIEPSSPNKPQPQTKYGLKRPWLHLLIFSVVNAIILYGLYMLMNITILSMLNPFALPAGVFYVQIFGAGYLSVHLLLFAIELTLAVAVFFRVYRRYRLSIPKIVVCLVIVVIGYSGLSIPKYVLQIQETAANPVEVGEKKFDFSNDETVINSRKSAKNTLAISGNAVIWVEHTKEAPPYDYNAWDLFLFVFNKDSGTGETIKLTNTENNISKSPDTAIIDGDNIYWTVDAKLYRYSISMRKQEVVREKTGSIYGINDNIAMVSDLDESMYGGIDIGGVTEKGVYFVDLFTKETVQDLSQYKDGSHVLGAVGRDVFCPYDYSTGVGAIIPIATESRKREFQLPYSGEYANEIIACAEDRVVFTNYENGLQLYDVKTAATSTINGSIKSATAKVIDETLYFVGNENHKLQKYSVETGKIVDLMTLPSDDWPDHINYWGIHEGYMTYFENTSEYETNVLLRKLP